MSCRRNEILKVNQNVGMDMLVRGAKNVRNLKAKPYRKFMTLIIFSFMKEKKWVEFQLKSWLICRK